ncbi:MAG: hypothetical protein IPN53_07485 [Comamonadaceae bacterium]|nr:hypothetical protein [Comamonadaceae bacterium]
MRTASNILGLILFTLYVSNSLLAQVVLETPIDISFNYDPMQSISSQKMWKTERYSWGIQKLPPGYSKSTQEEFEGNFLHIVGKTNRHEGSTTQWLSFNVIFTNFFKTSGHLAVIGRAESSAYTNRGRGFIIGRNQRFDDLPACTDSGTGTAWTQPEIWWIDMEEANPVKMQRNWVGGGQWCGQTNLSDGILYRVTMHLSDESTSYWISQEGLNMPITITSFSNFEKKETAIINSRSGYTFGIAFGSGKIPWKIDITNIATGWF